MAGDNGKAGLLGLLIVAFLLAWSSTNRPAAAWAADPTAVTGTPTLIPVATETPAPSATAAPSATPTPTAVPSPTPTTTPQGRRRPLPEIVPTPTSTPVSEPALHPVPIVSTATPTASATTTLEIHRRQHAPAARHSRSVPRKASRTQHKARSRPRPRHTPTPTPTATPPVTLQTDNTIAPVVCNGPQRPDATHPFLYPPYQGWTSIVSYFDHDMPTYYQDGLIIAANGLEARPDNVHSAPDFPAYWDSSLRQYVYYDGHNGYDYDLSYQPIYAAAAGTVMFARMEYPGSPHLGYGNMILINHHNGYITLYGHFSRLLVHKGEKVKRGQIIGISGNTGHSSGPHLHFTVFHNCSPTDPYGWTGPGPDPLAQYQGETSTYLWARQPLVINPLPDWPGAASLPGTFLERLLLLRLPAVRRGSAAFTRALKAEAVRVRRALGGAAGTVKIDLLRGTVDITAPLPPSRLYALPDVVSIGSLDAAFPARADVLAALARAALISPPHGAHLAHTPQWAGYIVRWQGQTVLLGRGARSRQVSVRLTRGRKVLHYSPVATDPHSGAYAVDLGDLSPSELRDLELALTGQRHSSRTAVSVKEVAPPRPARVVRPETRTGRMNMTGMVIILGLVVVIGAALATARRFRAHP